MKTKKSKREEAIERITKDITNYKKELMKTDDEEELKNINSKIKKAEITIENTQKKL